jgi:hypothetical protein
MSVPTRLEIIEESDRRWPDYESMVHHGKSGGFLDGATYAADHPDDDRPAVTVVAELYAPNPSADEAEITVTKWRREGAEQGVRWARERIWS